MQRAYLNMGGIFAGCFALFGSILSTSTASDNISADELFWCDVLEATAYESMALRQAGYPAYQVAADLRQQIYGMQSDTGADKEFIDTMIYMSRRVVDAAFKIPRYELDSIREEAAHRFAALSRDRCLEAAK